MPLKLKTPKSKFLILAMAAVALAVVILSAWGIKANRSSIKEFAAYAASQAQIFNKQNSSLLKQGSAQSDTSSSSGLAGAKTSPSTQNTSSQSPASSTSQTTVSAADKEKATVQIEAIDSDLEVYDTDNGFYPDNIRYTTFESLGADSSAFTPPSGIHFVYSPTPAGCTTAAQNCQHWTLEAVDSNGNLVAPEQKSFN